MGGDKQKYYLNISDMDHSVFHAWITEEQKNFIKKCFGQVKSYKHNPFVDEIIDAVCFYFNIPAEPLYERGRNPGIVRGRYLCFYFFVKKLHYSTAKAGKILNKDHATVLYGLKNVEANHKNDVMEIEKILRKK